MTAVKYPNVTVQVVGENGNCVAITKRVAKALRQAGVSQSEVDKYLKEARSASYVNVIQTTEHWVNVK